MQATLLSGRFFEETDEQGKPLVAIIDETTARHYWPGQEPVGKRFSRGRRGAPVWTTVVDVIKDIKHDGLDKDGIPHIYAPIYQLPGRALAVAVKTSLAPSSLDGPIRSEIQSVDPALPVFSVRSMDDLIGESLAPRRFSAELVGVFAVLAVLSASIGIYGLLAYMVSQRTQEIGIRMALGAQASDIRDLILGRGVALTGAGLAIGLILGAIVAPATAALLYGVRPMDPVVFLAVPTLLGGVALFASYLAARRAARIEPNKALR